MASFLTPEGLSKHVQLAKSLPAGIELRVSSHRKTHFRVIVEVQEVARKKLMPLMLVLISEQGMPTVELTPDSVTGQADIPCEYDTTNPPKIPNIIDHGAPDIVERYRRHAAKKFSHQR